MSEKPIFVLVTGSRHWKDKYTMGNRLFQYHHLSERMVLIHGDAPGADTLSVTIAEIDNWSQVIAFPAEWKNYGRSAGPIRNKKMLDFLLLMRTLSCEVVVEAFPLPDSIGTLHMMKIAKKAGITVHVTQPESDS